MESENMKITTQKPQGQKQQNKQQGQKQQNKAQNKTQQGQKQQNKQQGQKPITQKTGKTNKKKFTNPANEQQSQKPQQSQVNKTNHGKVIKKENINKYLGKCYFHEFRDSIGKKIMLIDLDNIIINDYIQPAIYKLDENYFKRLLIDGVEVPCYTIDTRKQIMFVIKESYLNFVNDVNRLVKFYNINEVYYVSDKRKWERDYVYNSDLFIKIPEILTSEKPEKKETETKQTTQEPEKKEQEKTTEATEITEEKQTTETEPTEEKQQEKQPENIITKINKLLDIKISCLDKKQKDYVIKINDELIEIYIDLIAKYIAPYPGPEKEIIADIYKSCFGYQDEGVQRLTTSIVKCLIMNSIEYDLKKFKYSKDSLCKQIIESDNKLNIVKVKQHSVIAKSEADIEMKQIITSMQDIENDLSFMVISNDNDYIFLYSDVPNLYLMNTMIKQNKDFIMYPYDIATNLLYSVIKKDYSINVYQYIIRLMAMFGNHSYELSKHEISIKNFKDEDNQLDEAKLSSLFIKGHANKDTIKDTKLYNALVKHGYEYNKNGILDYIIFDEVIKDYDEELYKVYSKYVNIYSNIEVFNDYEDVTYGYENIDNLLNRKLTDYTTNTHHFNIYDIDAERVGYKEDGIKARSVNLDLFRYIKLSAKKY